MDVTEKILSLLTDGPQEAEELGRRIGLRGQSLASLLMKLEKESAIVWDRGVWRLGESSGQRGTSEGDHVL